MLSSLNEKERTFSEEQDASSGFVTRNVTVAGRRTSLRLEPEMWLALKEIGQREKCTIHDLCTLVHLRKNEMSSLASALRVFVMLYFRAAATEDGHARSGHGSFEKMQSRARVTIPEKIVSTNILSDGFEKNREGEQ